MRGGGSNRFLFRDRLASALARGDDAGTAIAVICLDVDGFKAVNDTFGHAVGDSLLKVVAGRLRASLRACDTVARFGGDEFTVLQAPIGGPNDAARLAEHLVATLAAPYAINGRELRISTSVGIAVARSSDVDPAHLLGSADAALYRAKRGGRNTFRFAEEVPSTATVSRLAAFADRMRSFGEGGIDVRAATAS